LGLRYRRWLFVNRARHCADRLRLLMSKKVSGMLDKL
jgi:hypothetical protein